MASNKSLTISFFGRDVSLNKTLEGIKKNTFSTSNVLEQSSRKATWVLAGLSAAAVKFAKAAADDEKGAVSLANTLKTVVHAGSAQVASVEAFIKKAETFSTVADDNIRPAFDTLVRSTQNIAKAQDLTNLALEIAQKKGVGVEEVAQALAKANRGQFKALQNLGVIIPKVTKGQTLYASQMKVVNGQLVTVQKNIGKSKAGVVDFNKVVIQAHKDYDGSIAAVSETTAYKFAQFQRAMDNTQETLGGMLLPYMKDLADWLSKIAPWVERNQGLVKTLAIGIGSLAIAVKVLNATFKAMQAAKVIAAFLGIGTAAATAGAEGAAAGTALSLAWAPWIAGILAVAAVVGAVGWLLTRKPSKKTSAPSGDNSWASMKYTGTGGGPSSFMFGNQSVPKMAKGGIVRRPTLALIGEAGPEAVVPLSRGGAGGVTIIQHIQGSVVTQKELSKAVRDDLAQLLRRKGLNPALLGV